ncbi:hypothetical protein N665_1418s0001 [Sinapis alba]|nr:hypothetical protein N665_1418s0001 [Sinapis alba]
MTELGFSFAAQIDVPQDQARDYPPILYAKGDYNPENNVINHSCHMGDFPIVRKAIRGDVWDHLKEFPIGIIAKLDDSKFLWSGRTVHYILCRQLRVYKKEIWSLVFDQPIRFCELNVPHGMRPKLNELRPALGVCQSWNFEKRKWIGLLLLQTIGLYALHHNSRIPFESTKRIFDDEPIMTYPWFPQWPDEVDDPQLVNLITYIHAGRFVGSFWDVQRNENKKRTKSEVSSATEAPKKKQKKEKKKKNAEGKVATEEATIAALKSIMITLDNISRKVDNYDDRFEMVDSRLTVYGSNIVDLARDISNIDKNIGVRVEAAVYERLKDLRVGENNKSVNSPPPMVNNTLAKTFVNIPSTTAHTTPAKGSGVKISLAEQVAKADATGLGAKLNSEDEVAKATEVKKNLVKDFGNTKVDFIGVSPAKDPSYGRGCRGKPKQKEDEEVAAKKKEVAELKRKHAENQKAAELKKQKTELHKNTHIIRRTRACVIRIPITQKKQIQDDNELVDVTDDHVALQNELLLESDVEEDERIRSARINFYRERGAQLSPNGLTVMPTTVAPSARVFPYIEDNRTTCMRKDIEPSAAIYDPIAPADPVKIDKLMQHLQSFEYGPLHHLNIPLQQGHEDIEFYRILITERPWPDLEYGWWYQNRIAAFIRVIIQRSKRDPSPFWSKRISFIDSWYLGVWKVLAAFSPLTQMIPAMMSEVIPASIRKPSYKQFAFRRRKDKYIPQNDIVGDCGVYSLKFIKILALDVTFDGISDQNIQGLLENSFNAILISADRDNLPVLYPGPGAFIDQTSQKIIRDPRHNTVVWTRFNLVARTMFCFEMRELKRIWVHGGEKPKWMLTSVWLNLVDMFEEFGPDNFGFRM